MPNGSKLKEIKNDAFSLTPNLKEFNFLGSCDLTQIGTNAFANCTKLKTFDFPKSVTSIGRNAFSGCIYNHRTTKTNQKYPSVNL